MADCLDKLVKAVPEMTDSEIVVLAEKVEGTEVPQCINNPRDFRAALVAGERLFSQYKYNQAGMPPMSIPELCMLFDIGKTKLYKILHGSKYGKEEGRFFGRDNCRNNYFFYFYAWLALDYQSTTFLF